MAIRHTYSWGLALALVAGLMLAWAGRSVAAEKQPRIVSLSPHITELLFAAGAGDHVVGVDDQSDYPPAVAGIPRVGEPAALDVEALLKLKPTLVVLWDSGTPASRKAEFEQRCADIVQAVLLRDIQLE